MPKGSNKLIIAGKAFDIDCPTVNFQDPEGFNAHILGCAPAGKIVPVCKPDGSPREPAKGLEGKIQRYRARHIAGNERTVAAAQAVIKQFVIHLDGCRDADMCFDVLHNERGLSCHFVLDNDGTLYQTLDLIDCAYHAAGLNETSIGIEICNRGNAAKEPTYYDYPGAIPREQVVCTINNDKYVAFDYTKQQYQSMEALGKALAKLLPGIKLHYPQTAGGEQNWNTLDPTDLTSARLRESYSGYIGHYHITNQKWDPGPFDFRAFIGKLSGHRAFPVGLHKLAEKTAIPDAPPPSASREVRNDYDRLFDAYYENNELEGMGGFYPIGPLDLYRLWHGGIHLHVEEGAKVIAPLPGKVVVARNGEISGKVGSTNFVLLKHDFPIGNEKPIFYSLFYHLTQEKPTKKGERLKWMGNEQWSESEPGRTVVLTNPEPVQAGDIIGHIGQAGPDFEHFEAQLHWEIFTGDNLPFMRLDKQQFWHEISGRNDQRFCSNKEILDKIDTKPRGGDGRISQDELNDAFHGDLGDREWTRHVVASHYSEWSDYPDWIAALAAAPEFAKRPREAEQLVNDQILPGLWLTGEVAQKIGLAAQAPIFTFHPVSFMRWLNGLMASKDSNGLRKASKDDYLTANKTGKTDLDDHEGTSFIEVADLKPVELQKQLQLRDIIDGYGD